MLLQRGFSPSFDNLKKLDSRLARKTGLSGMTVFEKMLFV